MRRLINGKDSLMEMKRQGLRQLLNLDQKKDKMIQDMQKMLHNTKIQLYDTEISRIGKKKVNMEIADESGENMMISQEQCEPDFQDSIQQINSNIGSMGICAKQMKPGDVAWRCLDCEKDPTCIICKDCFEKADHEGHRVQLKRNVGGCCDCGDPEAWDPEHFCSDHKGYGQKPEDILKKLPKGVKQSADLAFGELCVELKKYCMILQNIDEESEKLDMTKDQLRHAAKQIILIIFAFLNDRIEEVPAFLYIVDQKLNSVYFDEESFVKSREHECCWRSFATQQQKDKFEADFEKLDPYFKKQVCTCTPLDLCFQTNNMLSKEAKKVIYGFLFKMFQSYTFKQSLTLSFAANYDTCLQDIQATNYDISGISVQVLTSPELTLLIYKDEQLLNNLLNTLENNIKALVQTPRSSDVNYRCRHIIHDIKYLARPECLQFCIQNTQMIERLIKIGGEIYFCDIKEPRTSMINYMQDGGPFEELLNIELLLIKILNIYLKEVKFDDLEKNQSIFQAFIETFQWIDKKLKSQNKTSHGLYVLPIHRCFSFYITRLLFLNYYDSHCQNYIANTYPGQELGMDQVFRMIFRSNLPQQYRSILQDIKVTEQPQIQQQKDQIQVSKFDLEKVEDIESIFKNKVENMFTQGETKLATLKEAFQASSLLNEDESDEFPSEDPLSYDDFFPSTDHEYSDQIPRSSKKQWKTAFKTIEDLIKMVLKTQIMQMSFLHEVSARKWIYHGQYLEMYPRLYFNVCDRLSFQDYASFQTLLGLDDQNSQLMNFVIDNFGLDGQLQVLIQGLKKEILRPMEFKRYKGFDSEKLRVQLVFFLRFLAQICVHEVAYLKQIYSRKDKDERQEENFDKNKQFFKKTWTNAVKKEAVHLLMLNRVNVSIQNLKKDMIEIFPKDEVFEDMLFEVSTQSRDIKNQVTFKLKDEYYCWFDPFLYISIDQHSQIFQAFQQNNLKDKFLDQGLNDIVGDYDSNYEFSTPLNNFLARSLAGSSILMIIVPLLTNYLKYRKEGPPAEHAPEEGKKDSEQPGGKFSKLIGMMTGEEEQKDEKNNEETEFFTKMIELKRKMSTSGEKSNNDSSAGKRISDLLLNKSPFSSGQKSERKQCQIDEVFLYKFVNIDVWKHCLKILVIVLKSGRESVVDQMSEVMVKEMVAYKDDADVTTSEKRLLVFILTRIYELDKLRFKHVGINLGLELPNDNPFLNPEFESSLSSSLIVQKPIETKTDKSEEILDDKKKLKLQKKKNNLLNKMKKKGNKFLADKTQVDPKAKGDSKKDDEKDKEECPQCSFCWGELTKESFLESPFGNFAHCGSSKLLYHSYEQTIKSQEEAFRNEDLSQQFAQLTVENTGVQEQDEEEKKQSSSLVEAEYEEEKKQETQFSSSLADQEEEEKSEDLGNSIFDTFLSKIKKKKEQKPLNLQKLEIVEEICGHHSSKDDQTSFMNVYSGAGSIINNCKHYSHIECLRDYQQQQATISDHNYYKQLSGFSFGEFSCPLCKSINNCIMPAYALPEIVDEIPDQQFVIDQNMKNLLDFYIDFFSELIKQQAGMSLHGESRSTVLRDLIGEPQRVLNHMIDHFVHRICLVDLKGIADFGKEYGFDQLIKMWRSLEFVMHYTYKGDHDVLAPAKKSSSFIPLKHTLFTYMDQYLEAAFNVEDPQYQPILFRNITTVVIKLILVASMLDKESSKQILETFMPLIDVQFSLATHFRSQSGKVGNLPESLEELQEASPEIKLPVYRKLFIVVQMVQRSPGALEAVLNQKSDEDELKTLKDYCNNMKSSERDENLSSPLQDLLQPYTEQFSQTCYTALKNHLQNCRPKRMPLNLMLLTPYHNFQLLELPDTFLSLQTTFYKKKCNYCDVEKQDSATCLLCGQTMCWFKVKDGPCRNHPGQDKMEGLLSYHTRLHEGGTAIFIQTSSGALIYIQNGSSAKFDTPYRNKYGELANPQDKRWDSFVRDDETLKKVKQTIVDFQVSNCILQQRTNPDQRYKVYHKDAI